MRHRPLIRVLCLTAILASVGILGGCASSPPRQTETVQESPVTGNWIWVETSGGKMGTRVTPRDAGYQMGIAFGTDGTVIASIDGEQWVRGVYSVEQDTEGLKVTYTFSMLGADDTVLDWGGMERPVTHWATFDRDGLLVLDEGCCDRYKHVFRRDQ